MCATLGTVVVSFGRLSLVPLLCVTGCGQARHWHLENGRYHQGALEIQTTFSRLLLLKEVGSLPGTRLVDEVIDPLIASCQVLPDGGGVKVGIGAKNTGFVPISSLADALGKEIKDLGKVRPPFLTACMEQSLAV